MNKKIFVLLSLILILILPLINAATVNDVWFTGGITSSPGLKNVGAEIIPNVNITNVLVYSKAAFNQSSNTLVVFAGNTSLLGNYSISYNNSANQYYFNLSGLQFNASQKYGFFVTNSSGGSVNVQFLSAGGIITGTNLNYSTGSYYSNATAYFLYSATQEWGFESITSSTIPTNSSRQTVGAYNYFTNASINSFNVLVDQSNNSLPYEPVGNISAWYMMDENNQSASDASGNGNTGTLSGWTFNNGTTGANATITSSGYFGKGLLLNETITSAMSVTYTQSLNLTNRSISLSLWIYPTTANTFYIADSYGGNNKGWDVYRNADGSVTTTTYNGSTGNALTTPANFLPLNTWNYVTFIFNTTASYAYINGTLNTTCTSCNTTNRVDNNFLSFGVATWNSNFRKGKGTWDEIRLWNTSLTSTQILQEMNSSLPINGVGLVASYSFESNVSTSIYDTNNLVAGQINGSFNFNGVSTKVSTNLNFNQSTETYTAWVYPRTCTGFQNIMGMQGSDQIVLQQATCKPFFQSSGASVSTVAMTVNQWNFIAVNISGTTATWTVNGQNGGSSSFTSKLNTSNSFSIGYITGGSNYFNGSIDDVRIYNTSLTQSQITALYNAGVYRIYNYTTTNGVISLPFSSAYTGQLNLSFYSTESPVYWSQTYLNLYTNATINKSLEPTYLVNRSIYAYNVYTNYNLNNFTVFDQFGNYSSTTTGLINASLYHVFNQSPTYNLSFLSNQSGGYFNVSYLNTRVDSTVNKSMSQVYAAFYASELMTGTNLSGGQFYVTSYTNATLNGSEGYVFNLSAGTYNVTYVKSGYYNKTQSYTFSALTSNSNTITEVFNQTLNLTAFYALNGSSINTFTVTLSNSTYGYSQSYNVTNGLAQFNLTSNIQYAVLVNLTSGTFGNATSFNSSLNATSLNVSLVSTTQFNLYFYDENTLQTVTNVNYTIVGTTYAYNGSTTSTSNNANFTALQTDSYEIRYTQNGGNYTYRSYFIDVPLSTPSLANLSLYMLPVSNATSFTLTVTDTYNQAKSGFVVSLLRRYAINGATTYYVVEMMKPSVALQGVTPFVGVANTIPYIFRVQDASGNILFQGAGTSSSNLDTLYLISSAIYIKVQTAYSVLQPAINFQGLSTTLTNTSTAVQLSWSDLSYSLSNICIYMYTNTTTLQGTSCSAASQYSGTISYTYNPVNGTVYTAYVYATSSLDNQPYLIGNPFVDDHRVATTSPGWGYLGVFFVIILMMIVGITFADRPSVAILIGSITMFTFFTINAFGNIISLPTATSAILGSSFLVIGILIMISMREEF